MHRTPILRKKLSHSQSYQGKLIIGIIGTHKGAGVTHTGIMIANYMSRCLGKKTVFIEFSPQNDIRYIEYSLYGEDTNEEDRAFEVHKVTYYNCVKGQEIAEIISDKYDCVVLDLGTDFVKNKSEFLRCDKKLIVGSLSLWKKHELIKFINATDHINNSGQWIYTVPFRHSKCLKEGAKEMNRVLHGIPYEPDPFSLTNETIQALQKLI